MARIIYQIDDNGIYSVDPDRIPPNENPLGKTVKQLIQDDIIAGSNKTGYREYVKVFEQHKVLSISEVQEWRTKLPAQEKELPDLSKVTGLTT